MNKSREKKGAVIFSSLLGHFFGRLKCSDKQHVPGGRTSLHCVLVKWGHCTFCGHASHHSQEVDTNTRGDSDGPQTSGPPQPPLCQEIFLFWLENIVQQLCFSLCFNRQTQEPTWISLVVQTLALIPAQQRD